VPQNYDALLVLSFGGPEQRADVIPFLENVLRGRNVPRERMIEVAEHYYHFGGASPINAQNRELVRALAADLRQHGLALPVYWANRNWHPFLAATLADMRSGGIKRALVFVTSVFSSYSGCRQYLEDLDRARVELGPGAPATDKLRSFFNHPGFVATMAERVQNAFLKVPEQRRAAAKLIFTAHSIPISMAASSPYVQQLQESCKLIAAASGRTEWSLAFQSRSGPPTQSWLEPDILDALRALPPLGVRDAIVVPVGFVSDHMEVLYDLDTEAAALAESLGLNLVRASTAGSHPRFIKMIRELVAERINDEPAAAMGDLPARSHCCAPDCCSPPRRPGA
jgi:protoporphyrin/coproporphyrin ferrochelatase